MRHIFVILAIFGSGYATSAQGAEENIPRVSCEGGVFKSYTAVAVSKGVPLVTSSDAESQRKMQNEPDRSYYSEPVAGFQVIATRSMGMHPGQIAVTIRYQNGPQSSFDATGRGSVTVSVAGSPMITCYASMEN